MAKGDMCDLGWLCQSQTASGRETDKHANESQKS
jgi:hypothetical protein